MSKQWARRTFAPAIAVLILLWSAVAAHAAVQAVIDTDEARATPVPHRFIHGTILDDAKFQILLPAQWNGKVVIHTRGFSGTEFSTGAFLPAALAKGYAFAASDEGWNRVTIRNEPEDTYNESRQRLVELTLYMNQVVQAHYGRASTRTLIMGGSNGGHHTKWMLEDFPNLYDGGVAGYGFNAQISQWGSIATVIRNYDVIAPRIDDIIARRAARPELEPVPPAALAAAHLGAAQGAEQHLRHPGEPAVQRLQVQRRALARVGSDLEAAVPGAGRLPARLHAALRPDLQPQRRRAAR